MLSFCSGSFCFFTKLIVCFKSYCFDIVYFVGGELSSEPSLCKYFNELLAYNLLANSFSYRSLKERSWSSFNSGVRSDSDSSSCSLLLGCLRIVLFKFLTVGLRVRVRKREASSGETPFLKIAGNVTLSYSYPRGLQFSVYCYGFSILCFSFYTKSSFVSVVCKGGRLSPKIGKWISFCLCLVSTMAFRGISSCLEVQWSS